MIAVVGGKWDLPHEFPEEVNGNSGDMIHTMAPLRILPNAVHQSDPMFRLSGARNFRRYINKHSSHVALVLANVLRSELPDGSPYSRLLNSLKKYEKPIVVFGLGVQSESMDLDSISLPPEATELMQFLSSKCELLGVRGPFTKKVLEELCGVQNAYVTGCPSLYARPEGIRSLRELWMGGVNEPGRHGVSVTNLQRPGERDLLVEAIRSGAYLLEPVSRSGFIYHKKLQAGASPELPYYFNGILNERASDIDELRVQEFYRNNFKIFRDAGSWIDFNRHHVSWSYGTRFHVNMATLLSGRPALWVTHDSRTQEMAEFMHLPNLPLSEVSGLTADRVRSRLDLTDFFDNITDLFDNFSHYLTANGLPGLDPLFPGE